MRIVAGAAGSLGLSVPRSGTRPTSDRVREALFSSLESMNAVSGMRVLDLYAGSGALALEAVSRGAASAMLVEQNAQAAGVCRANAASVVAATAKARTGVRAAVEVRQNTVGSFLAQTPGRAFDLVFLDPPYDVDEQELGRVLAALAPWLAPEAVVVVERSARSPEPSWPVTLEPFRSRSYGETMISFAQPAAPSQSA